MSLTATTASRYHEQGFEHVRGVFDVADFSAFTEAFLDLVAQRSGRHFAGLHDPDLRDLLDTNRALESDLYNLARGTSEIRDVASDHRVVSALGPLTGTPRIGLLEKMILRIDLPAWDHEIAHWHQDHFFVKGNTETITAWIPLQDVDVENGCLLVAPGSHRRGSVDHPATIGKRPVPSPGVIDALQPITLPMALGDVLLFHSLLLHSGQPNRSASSRYSFQFRYSPLGLPTDPGMGALLPLPA